MADRLGSWAQLIRVSARTEPVELSSCHVAIGDELVAAIFAEPQVDAHRWVYADWLCDRGDPRGEFIQLQLADHDARASDADRARAQALADAHAKAWIGSLDHVLVRKSVVFERGFPTRARCKPGLRKPERYFGEPSWATLEHLDDPPLRLIREPSLISLRSMSLHRDQARQLLGESRPLPRIDALEVRATADRGAVLYGDEQDVYERCTCLPALTTLRFMHFQAGLPSSWLWVSRIGEVRSLAVFGDHRPRVGPAGHWGQWLRGSPMTLEQVTFGDPDLEVTLDCGEARDWTGAELRLARHGIGGVERLEVELEDLAARGFTRLTVEPRLVDHIRRVLKSFDGRVSVCAASK